MKIFLLILILIVIPSSPAFAQLSDATGLVNRLDIQAGGNFYEVKVVANFDVTNHEFVIDDKRLTIFISSSLENNLGEIIIPQKLLSGSFSFKLNDKEYLPDHRSNDTISFITLNFTGTGNNKLDIMASEVLSSDTPTEIACPPGFEMINGDCLEQPNTNGDENGGCLIATAAYGSELAPQVQQLRELRDNTLLQTGVGTSFIKSFNTLYYSFSPTIADLERQSPIFKEAVKLSITPLISSLSILNYVDMDSEAKVLGYGISLIVLNLGMYFAAPAIIIHRIRK